MALAFDIGIGLWAVVLLALTINAAVALAVSWFRHKMGTIANMVYTGSGHFTAKQQHSANITRARYLKTKGRHEEALIVIDEYLGQVPDELEGLFLKAQSLIASAGDLALASRCLESVIKNAPVDDPFNRWAKGLLKTIGNGPVKYRLTQRNTTESKVDSNIKKLRAINGSGLHGRKPTAEKSSDRSPIRHHKNENEN